MINVNGKDIRVLATSAPCEPASLLLKAGCLLKVERFCLT